MTDYIHSPVLICCKIGNLRFLGWSSIFSDTMLSESGSTQSLCVLSSSSGSNVSSSSSPSLFKMLCCCSSPVYRTNLSYSITEQSTFLPLPFFVNSFLKLGCSSCASKFIVILSTELLLMISSLFAKTLSHVSI